MNKPELTRKISKSDVIIRPKRTLSPKSFHLLFAIVLFLVFIFVYTSGHINRHNPHDGCLHLKGLFWEMTGLQVTTPHSLRLGSLILGALSAANGWVALSSEPYRLFSFANFLNGFATLAFGLEAMFYSTISPIFFVTFWVAVSIGTIIEVRWRVRKVKPEITSNHIVTATNESVAENLSVGNSSSPKINSSPEIPPS